MRKGKLTKAEKALEDQLDKNPEAMKQLLRGMEEAKQGKAKKGSLNGKK